MVLDRSSQPEEHPRKEILRHVTAESPYCQGFAERQGCHFSVENQTLQAKQSFEVDSGNTPH